MIDVATGQPLKSLITNDGKIKANGGRVELTAAAARHVVDSVINTSGVIKANSIGKHNGMIVLGAATGGNQARRRAGAAVRVSGTLSAAGKKSGTTGGTILVTGEDIQFVNALVDASGSAGGGKVLIGGDWGGGNPTSGLVNNQSAKLENFPIPTATTVSVDAGTTINASAKERGNGGKVILWSDVQTTFAGTILARGGAQSRQRRLRGDVGQAAWPSTARSTRKHQMEPSARCCSIRRTITSTPRARRPPAIRRPPRSPRVPSLVN